ncbi:dihydroorotate dehydrogenase [Kiritimatiella glycovorans]|uniref:Dihydroorotate dehydrogenase n=1 Tax=Kiritimatiella glycovorans TaxID=1307763 RepID=A0A0G3EIM3_9BACT|nr:dihydroorotate dehydrogenase [Kiritimatiella glycovorans]AKJ65287.1 Dihydroorotate dehydrogenase B (NAD(+)), catalytic subunit [Kiritimatiella glycovorans]
MTHPAGKEPDLRVDMGGFEMPNPVAVASGTFGYGSEYAELIDLNHLGAIVVKGLRETPWIGNPPPRTHEVRSGMLNAIGLPGPGVERFLRDHLPFLNRYQVPVIVNLWGLDAEEYGRIAEQLDDVEGIDALELNVSCPNVKAGGVAFGTDPKLFAAVLDAVRPKTRKPLMPKLAPHVPDIGVFARAAQEHGADAISVMNTLPAMAIDIESRRPVLSNRHGGLSGPAIHPVAVKLVHDASRAVSIPVMGMGGVTCPEDALELLIAGASSVAVGTANFTDPGTAERVVAGIRDYLMRHDMKSVSELTLAE